jgi:NADH-quinone oxidoreductase subunit B
VGEENKSSSLRPDLDAYAAYLKSESCRPVSEQGREYGEGPLLRMKLTDTILKLCQANSLWPMTFGIACCAIEMICTAASRFDFSRFGMEIMRPSPRQADVMLVSGTVTKKMVPQIVRLYNQMPEPKYVVAMGACASGGGPFKEGYNVVSGIDKFLPVDVYIPGCPPTPQALLFGLMKLQEMIDNQSIKNVRWYQKEPLDAIPVPILGPDLIDTRDFPDFQEKLALAYPISEATEGEGVS